MNTWTIIYSNPIDGAHREAFSEGALHRTFTQAQIDDLEAGFLVKLGEWTLELA